MKKSEIYKVAQVAVLRDQSLSAITRLEVLRVLTKEEDLALFVEKEKEKKEQAVAENEAV